MANGYGYNGSSSSSSSSSPSGSVRQSRTNAQGQTAPPGFHYMPDGTLMSDAEHARLYASKKIIRSFNLDLSDLPASQEGRSFDIIGSKGSEFILEIKNEDNYYYNFSTKSFQSTVSRLEESIKSNKYSGIIIFPTVTDDDQYDFYLYAKPGTKHVDYKEVRFEDGSVDINSSIGSDSLMMRKVIYQYTDLTLTIRPDSPNSVTDLIKTSSRVDDTITISRGKNSGVIPFKISCEVNDVAKTYQIVRQPIERDFSIGAALTVGSAPELLPGEDQYPTVSDTDTVNGDFTAGTSNKVVMDSLVASKMLVGDKITAPTATNTVDGATTNTNRIVFDGNVASRCSVGDQLIVPSGGSTGDETLDMVLNKSIVTVTHLDPDTDNPKELQVDTILSCADGITITFSPKCNRLLTTVSALNPDDDNANEFQMDQNIGFVDGTTLSFSSQKNYQWPVDNINVVGVGMDVTNNVNIESGTQISNYVDSVTVFENTEKEQEIIKNKADFKNTKGAKPTITKGIVTTQTGNIVLNKQVKLPLAGGAIRVVGRGVDQLHKISGYEFRFTDLKVRLAPITTTTTAAVTNSTSVPVASRNGILDNVSIVSGIGIDPVKANPKVASGAGAVSGAGTIVLDIAQTLESGITLNIAKSGQKATVTGNIEILKAGTANKILKVNMENLISIT
tara:strand:- start:373 stop:2397 length:2025 start_codon:yes stop_codon:yes gene_type:complete